jgi:ribosome-associated protein
MDRESYILNLRGRDFLKECLFSGSRSSGPGGQSVNKVNTKMELRFSVASSSLLSEDEKLIVMEKLSGRINKDGELVLVSQTERSQIRNKEKVIEKFYSLLIRSLLPVKRRKPTKPSDASKEDRLLEKKKQAEKKERRKPL